MPDVFLLSLDPTIPSGRYLGTVSFIGQPALTYPNGSDAVVCTQDLTAIAAVPVVRIGQRGPAGTRPAAAGRDGRAVARSFHTLNTHGRNVRSRCPIRGIVAAALSETSLSRQDKRWNFVACLIDAVGWPLGAALISLQTIFPVFLGHLGAGNLAVGALPALYNLLLFLPGLWVAGHISRLRRARGYLFWVAIAERLALVPLAALTLLWGRTDPQRLLCGRVPLHRCSRRDDGAEPAGVLGRGRQMRPRPLARAAVRVRGRGRRECWAWASSACCATCCPGRRAGSPTATPTSFFSPLS